LSRVEVEGTRGPHDSGGSTIRRLMNWLTGGEIYWLKALGKGLTTCVQKQQLQGMDKKNTGKTQTDVNGKFSQRERGGDSYKAQKGTSHCRNFQGGGKQTQRRGDTF